MFLGPALANVGARRLFADGREVFGPHQPPGFGKACAGRGLDANPVGLALPFRSGAFGIDAADFIHVAQITSNWPLGRKSVVWGKSVSVCVDLGGRRLLKKKKRVHKMKYIIQ